ncbi:hypothetical protein BMS3Abin03_02773 [bacterium BMS3Abin03]|nr:hypothetical protein BMS3Abin03_02773 [bacterium BMS3Abin03]
MKRERKKRSLKRDLNQLSFDFTQNISIEIHIPKSSSVNYKKEINWGRKTAIELVRN